MESNLRKYLKERFKVGYYPETTSKISYVIGYTRDNETFSKQEVLDVIFDIMQEKL